MGHVKMAGPGFVNDVTAWWPGFVPKKITVIIAEGKNSVYLFIFCMNLGEINALLTISCCQMKHFGYVIVY
jgi:hypothetical protein